MPAKDYPLWLAWPVENINTPGGSDFWWKKMDRPAYSQTITQYAWKGYAPDWGAVNDKKSMDLDRADVNLKVWLGIEDEHEPPIPSLTYEHGWNDAMENVSKYSLENKR